MADHLGIEIVNAARRWLLARIQLRHALDSKSATPQQVQAKKRAYDRASQELEGATIRLERLIKAGGGLSMKKDAFPWQKLLTLISTGAKALEDAVNTGSAKAAGRLDDVIDVEAEEVRGGGKT